MVGYFEQYLAEKANFTLSELQKITAHTQLLHIKKGQNLYNEGSRWPYDGIVCKGLIYKHTTDLNNNTSIIGFASENYWVGDRTSTLTGNPAGYTATALEDTTIACLETTHFEALRVAIPTLNELCERLVQQHLESTRRRIAISMVQSDEERYARFLEKRPELSHRVPLALTAAYLGIPEKRMELLCNGLPWPQPQKANYLNTI